MRKVTTFLLGALLLWMQASFAHGPQPMPLRGVPIPPVPGLLDGASPIVVDKEKAIALGKALFWDVNVGSDGQACGSCHFHAGADNRVKNQINPGEKSSEPSGGTFEAMPAGGGGPNYTLKRSDFPTYRFNNPLDQTSGVAFETDDVISSAGTFSGNFQGASKFTGADDQCERAADPTFHLGIIGTRRVEPRNTPTVINDIFNYRNFWDGRANNIFNGSSSWGERDPDAGVWEKSGARSVKKVRLQLENSSLASLAVGPPLNPSEMSCRNRTWPAIGRKLLLRQPLQSQKVHHEDSVLGSLSLSAPGDLKPGLNTTYRNLVMQAFNSKYWAFSGIGKFGAPQGQAPYNQMEANFSMFFGLALQLYQSTLISDQAPIDLTPRDPISLLPTWEGLGYAPEKIARLKNGQDAFTNNHCNLCHAGPVMTTAAVVSNSMLVTPLEGATYGQDYSPIPFGENALGELNAAAAVGIGPHINLVTRDAVNAGVKLTDVGFANTGVIDPVSDPGVGGLDDFGNPLSFSSQYIQYLKGNYNNIKDPIVGKIRSCDFIASIAKNNTFPNLLTFNKADGLELDGSRPGETLRNQDCTNSANVWIPTINAANNAANLNFKLGVADLAGFKIPTLRNIELTGPYMHNGSMATLEQVLEFYSRHANNDNDDKHSLLNNITAGSAEQQRVDIIEFFKTFTDERVRYEKAPFDHPEIKVSHGHVIDEASHLSPELAKDEYIVVPAVGANGVENPIEPFENYLAE